MRLSGCHRQDQRQQQPKLPSGASAVGSERVRFCPFGVHRRRGVGHARREHRGLENRCGHCDYRRNGRWAGRAPHAGGGLCAAPPQGASRNRRAPTISTRRCSAGMTNGECSVDSHRAATPGVFGCDMNATERQDVSSAVAGILRVSGRISGVTGAGIAFIPRAAVLASQSHRSRVPPNHVSPVQTPTTPRLCKGPEDFLRQKYHSVQVSMSTETRSTHV